MTAGSLEDRLALRELSESYAARAMRIDIDGWGELWAEDGRWQLSSMPEPVIGKAEVISTFREKMDYVDYVSIMSFPADVEIDGDRAKGKAYCREWVYPKAGGKIAVVGCFHDEYVKQEGRWLFLSRRYEVIGKEVEAP